MRGSRSDWLRAVIASEAKQSIAPQQERMDCRVASLLAMTEERAKLQTPVIPRACGVSSTLRLIGSIIDVSGILDRPLSRTMTAESVLAARCARSFARNLAPLKTEGAGKTGCALHPRSHVRCVVKMLHMSIQVQRRTPGLPYAMALRLIRFRPGDRLSCHHHHWKLSPPPT
jgi:hypothetical protein